ncbi:MAG: BMP family ABC transporter substrate-binding protein [Spirochaetales bacterium]|nr:BMP family ABC transporter substrate-binding protein [Spirochaetales bacterium]
MIKKIVLLAAALTAGLGLIGCSHQSQQKASPGGKVLKIGFLYVGPKDDFGYNQSHAEGAAEIAQLPNVKIVEQENVPETVDVEKAMEGMIVQDGVSVIFATSFGYWDHVLKVALKYPNVKFFHCGGLYQADKDPPNVYSYFGYIEEGQYLNGIAAGYASKTGKLGFIAAKPIPQVLENINAFTLGARSVNPKATTTVVFTGGWSMPTQEANAANSLIDKGIDVITMHVDSPKVIVQTCEQRGVFVAGYHADQSSLAPKEYLTGAIWNWGAVYKTIVADIQAGKDPSHFIRGGMKDGFVKMAPFGPGVSATAKTKIESVLGKMMKGEFVIFKGPLKDNTGKVVIPAGTSEVQTDPVLEKMNYLVQGVIGSTGM